MNVQTLEERVGLKPRAANCGSRSAILHEMGKYHVFPVRCKSWNCPRCAQMNADLWAHRVAQQPCERFLTLTQIGDTREEIRHAVAKLFARIRKAGFKFEYWGMVELHKSGKPHWHSICHGDFLPPLFLKWACNEVGIGHSDIRKIKSNLGMAYYCVKHLAHAHGRRFEGRQVRYSKRFFVNSPPPREDEDDFVSGDWEVVFGRADYVSKKLGDLGYDVQNHDSKPDLLVGETYSDDQQYMWRERGMDKGYGVFEWKSMGVKYVEG